MERYKNRVLMLMVDGFGIPNEGWAGSIFGKYCSEEFIDFFERYSIPLDATLGISGIPQSATGQTSIFCGVNAPEFCNAHLPGFPNEKLRRIIREKNILLDLYRRGKKVFFANAYVTHSLNELLNTRFASVTTVMSNTVFKEVPGEKELLEGNAVYHDITRETLQNRFKLPLITPEEGAKDLLHISKNSDLTIFEYFMTDKAGHAGELKHVEHVLKIIDRFVCHLKNNLSKETVLIICSDHGNIEDPSTELHTLDKVPLIVYSKEKNIDTHKVKNIADIYNLIIGILL